MTTEEQTSSLVTLLDPQSRDVSLSSTVKIVSLIHPNTNKVQDFLQIGTTLHEIQAIERSSFGGSFFVGSRVVANGSLHTVTKVDPLFFMLPMLDKKLKWEPLPQMLTELPTEIQKAVSSDAQYKHLCATNDQLGDDMVLYKFQDERALAWLAKKHQATCAVVEAQLLQARIKKAQTNKDNGGAFSNQFRLPEEAEKENQQQRSQESDDADMNALSSAELCVAKQAALQIVCDYLNDDWRDKLCKHLNIELQIAKPAAAKTDDKDSNENLKKRKWEGQPGQSDADALLEFTMGGTGTTGGKTKEQVDASEKKKNAKSAGLKRLAKTNIKGMKSLSSFFGAKKAVSGKKK